MIPTEPKVRRDFQMQNMELWDKGIGALVALGDFPSREGGG
ncbi:MAG: hypothetical protein R2911_20020 [Caldilineaceae bacterium]